MNVYVDLYILPVLFLICIWIFVYLCQSSWPLNWKCFLAHNWLLWSIIFNVFIHLFWPDSDTLTYSEQHSQTGQNIILLISCVFNFFFFLYSFWQIMKSLKTSIKKKKLYHFGAVKTCLCFDHSETFHFSTQIVIFVC